MGNTRFDERSRGAVSRGDVPWAIEGYRHGVAVAAGSDAAVDRSVGGSVSDSIVESDREDDSSPARPQRQSTARLVVPVLGTIVTLLGLTVGLLAGFDVYAPRTTPLASALRAVLALGYVTVGLAGTVWVVDDARRLAEHGASWQPDPWSYVAAGTLILVAALSWWFQGVSVDRLGPFLFGATVVAVVCSSVVVGPVYLLQRYRQVGTA